MNRIRPRVVTTARTAQDSNEQTTRQNRQMRGYIEAHGWDFVGFSVDQGISGNTRPFTRVGLGLWLERPDAYDIILASRITVLSRSEQYAHELLEWAKQHGIEIWTVAEGNLTEVALTRLSTLSMRLGGHL